MPILRGSNHTDMTWRKLKMSKVHWHKNKSFLVVSTGNGWLGIVYGYDCQVAANSYDDCVSVCQANIEQIEKCDQVEDCLDESGDRYYIQSL